MSRDVGVSWLHDPGFDWRVIYQRYYLLGLERTGGIRIEGEPAWTRPLRGASTKVSALGAVARLRGLVHPPSISANGGLTGRYVLREGGRTVRFAIDARDTPVVRDPEIAAESDVFFKANAWPDREYPENVRPIVNGNGELTPRRIELLRSLRDSEKTVDLVAIVRIWDEGHTIRNLEELSRLDCSKRLLAVFARDTPADVRASVADRLGAAGVPVTSRELRPEALWRELASARIVFARPGKHRCFPWRTLDLLCIGACTLFDSLPPARWPVALTPGVQVESAGVSRADDELEAPAVEYAKLGAAVERLLADRRHAESVRREAAGYFERHASPEAVARYVRETLDPSQTR